MIDTKEKAVRLDAFLRKEDVHLDLRGTTQLEVMRELASSLGLDGERCSTLLKGLQRRESMESTALGHGVAVPHCRSSILPGLRVAFGRLQEPIPWGAADGEPVRSVFLLAAPHVSSEYLPVLAKIAHLVNHPDFRRRLSELQSTDEFFQLLAEAGV
ncbi:MAG TPA: PTS sugar transporter subunit IIA [Gemmatimonadales bacterium]|jgi:mannitol/fructose-specific phosphotransferase system IIA component (Ntr-type)